MRFWASVELYAPAGPATTRVRKFVEAHFQDTSSLDDLDCELRYVPIIMPADMQIRYPARSQMRRKARIYNCCPQLDFETFVTGTFEEQVGEYVRGIWDEAGELAKLGATSEQLAAFRNFLMELVLRARTHPDN